MENATELRPVSHEFYTDDDYHGAAFVGAKAADAMWFYRFDSSFIEVRDIFMCQDKVFASLSTLDIRQRFSQLLTSDEVCPSSTLSEQTLLLLKHELNKVSTLLLDSFVS